MNGVLAFLHGARKAFVAAAAAAGPVAVQAGQDGTVTGTEWAQIGGAALLAAVAVYWTPNRRPTPPPADPAP